MGTHNNKQNKTQLREEGVDPSMKGTKVPTGAADQMYWLPPERDTYVPFEDVHWEQIKAGSLKL